MDLDRLAASRPRAFSAALFAWSLALRAMLSVCAALLLGVDWRNLALFYDGSVYLHIAHSFPTLYGPPRDAIPHVFSDPAYYSGWFPLYPLLISAFGFLLRDLRAAALVVAQLSSSAAVVLFFRLARRFVPRPASAALVFSLFPAVWLLCGSLAFVEPVFVALSIAALLCHVERRGERALFLAGVVMTAQKSGFLVFLLIVALEWASGRLQGGRRRAAVLLALLPAAAQGAYLYRLFGNPLMGFEVQRKIQAGRTFTWPFLSMVSRLLSPYQIFAEHLWLHKALIGLSAAGYIGILVAALRTPRKDERPLVLWLGVTLLFNASLDGMRGYYPFPRFMTLAAPAAILLAARRTPDGLARRLPLIALVLVPLLLALNLVDVADSAGYNLRMWPPFFFQSLVVWFQRGGI